MSRDKKLREEIKVLRHHLENALAENKILRMKIDAMARQMFGKKSEQLNSGQLELLLAGLDSQPAQVDQEDEAQEEPPQRRRRPRTGQQAIRVPDDLEVIDEVLLPEPVRANPEQWKEIGREENKRLDYQPGKFFWRKTIRPKFVHRHDRGRAPVIAPAAHELSVGGKVSAGLLAHILASRHCDHQPYHRQQASYWRQNQVWISRQQLVEWSAQGVEQLSRVVDVMQKELRKRPYLQVDETPIRYQDKTRAGPCPKGWLWTGLDPGRGVVFHWDQSRGAEGLEKLIGKDYRGVLGVDGHSAYRRYVKEREDVGLIGCWTHARRNFVEAKNEAPKIAGWYLNQIQWLFRWEKSASKRRFRSGERDPIRASHSRLVIERVKRALDAHRGRFRPKSLMGEAIAYALNQWQPLAAVLDHPEAEISNNLVENAIRPSALGKRNWLFIGHRDVGQRSAVIYTLTETCRMLGVNPYDYLKDVLRRLPSTPDDQLAELTPANWLSSRSPRLQKAA